MEFNKILVPITGTKVDEEAMRLACRLTKKEKGKIWSVYVVTIKRSLPLDAEIASDIQKAEEVLGHIEMIAEKEGNEIETDILQALEAGPAIVDDAVERGIDIILLGASYKKRFGHFILCAVAPYVLTYPVFLLFL